MTILEGQCTRTDFNLTIYDETKFSSCHIPYTNNILHPVSSYYFLSHKKLFQAGNFNVNVRADMLYFSICGVYSKIYKKHKLWPVKTAKTLCTSSWRLIWWNVIHSTKISLVPLDLKAKGQKILYAILNSNMTCFFFPMKSTDTSRGILPNIPTHSHQPVVTGLFRESAFRESVLSPVFLVP